MMSVTPIRSVKGHSLCGSGKIAGNVLDSQFRLLDKAAGPALDAPKAKLAALLGKEEGHFLPREEKQAQKEEFDPKAIIGRYMEDEEETGFNLDDVLNPKGELDLAKLCRGLGLMDDPETNT